MSQINPKHVEVFCLSAPIKNTFIQRRGFFYWDKRKESPAMQILNEEGLNPMALMKFQIYRFPTYYQI